MIGVGGGALVQACAWPCCTFLSIYIKSGDNIFLYGACNVLIEMCGIKSLIINEYVAILGIESIMAQKIPNQWEF